MRARRGVAKRPLVDFANAEDARPRALAGLGVHEASRGGEPHERMRAPRVRATKQRVELFQVRGLVVVVVFVARVFGDDVCGRRLVVSAATRRRSFLESLARLRALRTAPPDPVGGHRAGRGRDRRRAPVRRLRRAARRGLPVDERFRF